MICTFPGKYGDLIWALPTVRQLAAANGKGLLVLPQALGSIAPLLRRQPYIQGVELVNDWVVQNTAPASPRIPPPDWLTGVEEAPYHLGYREWPKRALPFEVAHESAGVAAVDLDLSPWITVPPASRQGDAPILVAWTDEWFELKLGVTVWLQNNLGWNYQLTCQEGSRWESCRWKPLNWQHLASQIAAAKVVLTDCSAVHVLAAAIGTPVVVMEPNPHRHHFIFWPGSVPGAGGWCRASNALGDRIVPVIGGDGQPTFDCRHTKETLERFL